MASVEEAHWWCRARREIVAEVIRRYRPELSPADTRVAEIGCGTGGNLAMLAQFGEVLAAESEPTAVARVRARYGAAFRVVEHAVPEPLPMRFHVLAMLDVVEHIPDDAGALAWVGEQLEPGGIAVVTVPAFPFLWTEHDEAVHHFRRYTPASLSRIVPPSLTVEHLTCFNTLLFAPILAARTALRILPRRDRSPRSHMGKPPAPLNWLLYRLFRLERHFVPRRRWRWGVSVLAVLRRSSGSC